MLGFAVLISKNKPLEVDRNFLWKSTFSFQNECIIRNHSLDNIYIEQKTLKEGINNKTWINNSKYIIVIEGIITNTTDLCTTYNAKDIEDLIEKIGFRKQFFKEFKGNFVGYIYFKLENRHVLFNNHTATKRVFYFENEKHLIFSTDLYTLCKKLITIGVQYSLNIEAAYLLLTSGFMHENLTLVNQVYQLRAGEYLEISNGKTVVNFYFHLNNISECSDRKEIIINQLDLKFRKAIELEFGYDQRNKLTSITTISGGLDSRMTAMIAYKNNYRNQIFINFCEKGYADEIIADQISNDLDIPLEKYSLTANGLTAIDEIVKVNDGLNLYSGSGHSFEAIKNYKLQNTGMVHTGMIGDAVMGSFLSSKNENKPRIKSGLYSYGLFQKVQPVLEKYISNYKNEEVYKFYNRAFLGANNGFLFFDLIGESSSPFLEPDFLSYAYSIPFEYKYKERIYVDWIKAKHSDIAKYKWESIGGKPTNHSLIRQYYRYKRAVIKRLPIHTMWKNNMNPEQLWYDRNPNIKLHLDNYFKENIHRIDAYPELRNDVIHLYKSGNITEKTQAITLLAALKLLF